MANALRGLVSKKKRRFQQDGFDLDLTYIADNIIAMGFPSTGMEGVYRNPLPEVQRFFESRHPKHYKIYNLCSERAYDLSGLFWSVERCGFDDHNPCPLNMLKPFCESVDAWLKQDMANVAAIHCKAGKGRTGLMVSVYLLHSGACYTADEALYMFGKMRTLNGKGVTIPSQMRYVHYYEQLLRRGHVVTPQYMITHIRLITVPNFDVGGGCDPYFQVKHMWVQRQEDGTLAKNEVLIYDYKKQHKKGQLKKYRGDERFVDLDCSAHNVVVHGDIKIEFYDHDQYSSDDKMCHLWFHTAFIENNYLCFERAVIDKACKDKKHKHFDPNFKIEIFLHRLDDSPDYESEELLASDSAAARAGVAPGAPLVERTPAADAGVLQAPDPGVAAATE